MTKVMAEVSGSDCRSVAVSKVELFRDLGWYVGWCKLEKFESDCLNTRDDSVGHGQ